MSSFRNRDHPRACGENMEYIIGEMIGQGSPPRMRGKLLESQGLSVCYGITPAHAGKTMSITSSGAMPWDHPRACGENRLNSLWM